MQSLGIAIRMLIGLCSLFSLSACAGGTNAIKESGSYVSSDGQCTAVLKTAPAGGFLQLYIQTDAKHVSHVADDITGLAWTTSTSLVFSVSPIYGSPGIFLVACTKRPSVKMVVSPENIDAAYPKGADFFELRSVTNNKIEYYYGADVDNIEFEHFRSKGNLREARLP